MADTKQQWYKDAKYGLFIHWGLYSILAGEWKDPKTGEVTKTDRIAEWIENNLNIDKEDYRKLKDEFHPDKFDADMFVKRAKEQWGVKYIVLTSKHHEGFAMYNSKVSDFNVVKATGRDILRELSDACKKYDMTMGIYYSQAQDWDDDNAYKKDYEDKNEWKPEFRTYFDEKCKPQLKELLENYDEEIAATVKFIKYLTSVDSINEMCKSSPTTYAEKVTIDTGNYLLDDVNAIMAENTESKLEIPTYDSNTAAMDTIRNSLQALATGASAQEVGDDIVDKMSAYE